MYQKEEDPTCLFCNSNKEKIEHFVLTCKKLSDTRDPILLELDNYLSNCNIIFVSLARHSQLQIIMDATSLKKSKKQKDKNVSIIERCTRRLLFQLHITRAKLLKIV
jgi:hypothetical protein